MQKQKHIISITNHIWTIIDLEHISLSVEIWIQGIYKICYVLNDVVMENVSVASFI